jgi:hypothetical protein
MPQVPGVRPFDEGDLADQFRGDPAALLHFLCSQRLGPPRRLLLGQVFKRAVDNSQLLESREDFVPSSQHEAILHLRDKDELFVFVNAYEQCIEPMGTGNVTANDEILAAVRAELDPGT